MSLRALLSVSNKSGIESFAGGLREAGYEIISTGGTQKALEKAKIPVTSVGEITQFPECFGGRLKTLHPLIFGGLLYKRSDPEHMKQAKKLKVEPIDLVCVNLYPFQETAKKPGISRGELIEQIDIGGPSLLRAAAKNADDVTVVCDPQDYPRILKELKEYKKTSPELRRELAEKVFLHTASYDCAIASTLSEGRHAGLLLTNRMQLRYGENPHQWGAFYEYADSPPGWRVLQQEKKQMSYLNILDADGAWNLVCEFSEPTAACIKHANPSGVASHEDIAEAFQKSYDADRLSAFGVIIALNRKCSAAVIRKIIDQKIFVEIIIAPGYEPQALELLKSKPSIRIIEHHCPENADAPGYRSALDGMLVQNLDRKIVMEADLTCVTTLKPSKEQIANLLFAWKVVKHAKSNAIVFVKDACTVGIGAGQTSRVDSTIIAARRAGEKAKGAVMASDAFFPFPDSVEEAAKYSIAAIIQPGGSVRDEEVIAKANALKIPMVLTGVRGFRH
ncbi:MAG: bifunctional phosphoribosylaminoimidazolecarboxamide formyltransferase/IMP cyclohydrolase [Candidatus Peribacteraceae bacterium]|nr:bifunctional phosphoribosylaminoimidazolecarboxamide formyltransferase/IMP cyclohydrolase [Candidatus Peribacteraceae bacterium]